LAITNPSLSCDTVLRVSTHITDASLDARDQRFDQRAQAIFVLVAQHMEPLLIDIADDLVVPASTIPTMYDSIRWRRNHRHDTGLRERFAQRDVAVGATQPETPR
jgi:hypothetical protein